jgi:serine protease
MFSPPWHPRRRTRPGRARPARKARRAPRRLDVERLEDRWLPSVTALTPAPLYDPSHILVRFRDGAPADAGAALPLVSGLREVALDPGVSVDDAVAAYKQDPGVLYAQPDYRVQAAVTPTPTDASYTGGSLWGLYGKDTTPSNEYGINAPGAWAVTTGSTQTVVGVIDTGIDYTHPDLYQNIWINQGEIPAGAGVVDVVPPLADKGDGIITFWDLNQPANAGKVADGNGNGYVDAGDVLAAWSDRTDADGNGYVDDLVGWNFVANNNKPFDDYGHGTHVSGTIGATANDGGVVGINWDVELAALKFLDSSGSGTISDALKALDYAVNNHITISNNSWGGGGYNQAFYDGLKAARDADHIFVAAAGNSSANTDSSPSYPASYDLSNVVAVAAINSSGSLASFSNYGAKSVDLGAPGVSVLSTLPTSGPLSDPSGYGYLSGTSMATPHVTGVVALLRSLHPDWNYSQVIDQVLTTTAATSSLSGKTVTGGRLDAGAAVVPAGDTAGARVVASTPSGTLLGPVSSVQLTFNEPIQDGTFTADDIASFTGPGGVDLKPAITGVSGSGKVWTVSFASQSANGSYKMVVGPNILDLSGNAMNQDRDGTNGEATADQYAVKFTLGNEFSSGNVPLAIRDYTTTKSTLTIDQDITIDDLNVKLNISHTWDSDLYIYLKSPSGTTVLLSNHRGGSGDNFTNTVFDDEATTAIRYGTAPFAGSYRPEQALSVFDGKDAKGTWTLVVKDTAAGDTGTLNSWSLTIQARDSAPIGPASVGDTLTVGTPAADPGPDLRPADPVAAPAPRGLAAAGAGALSFVDAGLLLPSRSDGGAWSPGSGPGARPAGETARPAAADGLQVRGRDAFFATTESGLGEEVSGEGGSDLDGLAAALADPLHAGDEESLG